MLFNSFTYVFFFVGVLLSFYATPPRYRWLVLLCASYGFYWSWKPAYLGLIVASTLCDYFVALAMVQGGYSKRRCLAVTLIVNLGLLAFFKYGGFLNDSATLALEWGGLANPVEPFSLVIPVGISFYTFQTLSYSLDVYRGDQSPARHLGKFALFVAFFPQLIAGPIERAGTLLPQLSTLQSKFDYVRIRSGLQLILWGLFKKLVIADNLAPSVEDTYTVLGAAPGISVLVATIAFAVQIYCDFSGYCDIAVGTAQCFGIDLSDNFRSPYAATNLREFWARWHITLSRWFRDYVYIPLGGNRCSTRRIQFNLLLTFVLSGLWHGANWTFVYWGAIHGFALVAQRAMPSLPRAAHAIPRAIIHSLSVLMTFSVVCLAWIFFRADTVDHAFAGLVAVLTIDLSFAQPYHLELAAWSILALALTQTIQDIRIPLMRVPKVGRWIIYYALVLGIIRYGSVEQTPFVYFQF